MNYYSGGRGGRISPSDVFSVSNNVNYLDSAQLDQLENSFRKWIVAARRVDVIFSRERMLHLFLMLRFTGARLGEVLGLSDQDIMLNSSEVKIGDGDSARRVPLPADFSSELGSFLDSPARLVFKGKIFNFDQGHVRRYFYDRAESCGFSREMGAPKVIRNSRAVEMLRSGVPLTVVREVMGQASFDFANDFQCFTESDVSSIVKRLALSKMSHQTSARNTFIGHITSLAEDGLMASIDLKTESGLCVNSIITLESLHSLGLKNGSPVIATVKAPLLGVSPVNRETKLSASNCYETDVIRIKKTVVIAEITGKTATGLELCALISTEDLDEMQLEEGGRAVFYFKSLSVVLNTI
jgi:molybdate transport system regulatory protein